MKTRAQVLVIDDDAVVGRSFERVLTEKGYDVVTALSGEQGLKDMDSTDYDLVFTDIKMPGIDGIEVAERIKAKCPWTPVVVITGYGTEENEARASVLGVNGFVRKPLTPDMIESITLKALEKQPAQVLAANEDTAPVEPRVSELKGWRKALRIARNIALFFAAPFIALSYIIALPIVGFYTFAKLAVEAWQKKHAVN